MNTLQDSLKGGKEYRQNLRDNYHSIPKEAEITAEERVSFSENRATIENAIKQLGLRVTELLRGLEARIANPTNKVVVADALANFGLDKWLKHYATMERTMAVTVNRHNAAFTSFNSIQNDAFTKIEAHILALNQSEWNKLWKAVSDAAGKHKEAQKKERELTDRYLELLNDLQDHGVGAERMNDLIWSYLGHKELRV